MEDKTLICLLFDRDESALEKVHEKYGNLCFSIAHNILGDRGDAEECVNDTLLALWNAVPPEVPENFYAYIGKIARNLSLKRLRSINAGKRGPGPELSLDELVFSEAGDDSTEKKIDGALLTESINRFLKDLRTSERQVFIRRYWYFDSIDRIASGYGYSESKVKMMLSRTRDKLKVFLEKEGVSI